MTKLKTKIKLYLEANSKTWKAERKNIFLEDNNDGTFIKTWNVAGLNKPTAEQIASYETAGNAAEALADVLNKRSREYPSIADQLDKIYHDGVDEWKKVIKAVKDANPKG